MTTNQRTWTILIAGLGLLALILLAFSLNAVEMRPGTRIALPDVAPDLEPGPEVSGELPRSLLMVLRIVLICAWVMLPLYIIMLFKSKDARKKLLRDLALFLPVLLLLYIMSNNNPSNREGNEIDLGAFGQQSQDLGDLPPGEPMPEFTEPPAWVTTAVSLGLAVVVTLIAVGLVYFVWRRTRRQPMEPLLQVEREAQAAIDAIEAGGDLREVIIRCYVQMVQALNVYRSIQRERDMTPHEFELYLEQRGLPRAPVHELTQLFEQARYGAQRPGSHEERRALSSLNAIVNAVQKTRTT